MVRFFMIDAAAGSAAREGPTVPKANAVSAKPTYAFMDVSG
jgi:hypothetical protein